MTGEHDPAARHAEIDDVLDALSQWWHHHPYLRLGQLVAHASHLAGQPAFAVLDQDLVGALTMLSALEKRFPESEKSREAAPQEEA